MNDLKSINDIQFFLAVFLYRIGLKWSSGIAINVAIGS